MAGLDPAKVGESYFEYMAFAFGFAARLFKAGFAAFVHGVVSCLHETTASAEVMAIHDEIPRETGADGQGRTIARFWRSHIGLVEGA
jgi:Family of unknown function (DUF6356)